MFPDDFQTRWQGLSKGTEERLTLVSPTSQPPAGLTSREQPWEVSGCFLAHFAGKDRQARACPD